MALARNITVCALVAALCACGGSSDDNTTNAIDFVTLRIYGATATYTDDAPGVSILGMAGTSSTTVITLTAGNGAVYFSLGLPAGTGSQTGTLSTIMGGNSCTGAVTVNVTKHGTSMGSEVAGSLGPVSVNCPIGPSPQQVTASFSVTRL